MKNVATCKVVISFQLPSSIRVEPVLEIFDRQKFSRGLAAVRGSPLDKQ